MYIHLFISIYTYAAKSLQSCPTLCDTMDSSPPGSPSPGILQARTLEWVASSFSNAWKWKVKVKSLSHIRLFTTPWTAVHQAPPSMGVSRQAYWSGVPSPSLIYICLYIHTSILFQILFPFRLLQNIEQSSLCSTAGLCWLSVVNTIVCVHQSLDTL